MVKLEEALKDIKYFLLDMDGTVYLGDKLIGEMDKTLDFLREQGKKIVYLTNNSSKSRKEYENKLRSMNLYRTGDFVYSSGMATADYLNERFKGKTVYLVGTNALKEEFKEHNVALIENEVPDVCVLAFDTELTYQKLEKFNKFIKKGAYYIATHPDITCPAPEVFIPDVGSFIELFKASSGLIPREIVGKPSTIMGENLLKRFKAEKKNFVMVGDRLHTDIKFGVNCGFYTIMVESGECTKEDIKKYDFKPNFILGDLNEIKKYFYGERYV